MITVEVEHLVFVVIILSLEIIILSLRPMIFNLVFYRYMEIGW